MLPYSFEAERIVALGGSSELSATLTISVLRALGSACETEAAIEASEMTL